MKVSGKVVDAGGGEIRIVVDRDTERYLHVGTAVVFECEPRTVTVRQLIANSAAWWDLDIPFRVRIDGVDHLLDYSYCSSDGVHFEVVP